MELAERRLFGMIAAEIGPCASLVVDDANSALLAGSVVQEADYRIRASAGLRRLQRKIDAAVRALEILEASHQEQAA